MLNLRKIVVAFSMALLFSTASFASSTVVTAVVPTSSAYDVVLNSLETDATQSSVDDDDFIRECCGECEAGVNLLIFTFKYKWCCNWCKEEQENQENIE